MFHEEFKPNYLLIFLLPVSLTLTHFASEHPALTEAIYSKGIYGFIGRALSLLSGFIPFSIGEILFYAFIIFSCCYVVVGLRILLKRRHCIRKILFKSFMDIITFFSTIYFIFILLWGLNYHRLQFADISNMAVGPTSVAILKDLCHDLVQKANTLRHQTSTPEENLTYNANTKRTILMRANLGYKNASKLYPELGGHYGQPKGVLFSKGLSYSGISGIYSPFTGEANVNMDIPIVMLAVTTCHEMAHQRGFAREDEANYIAYLTCTLHPDVDFQYSGTLLGLIYAMNTLYEYDIDAYKDLQAMYSQGVLSDLKFISAYWQQYEGPIERASSKMNNYYLKSNNQRDGTQSYGRMIDLLIAEYQIKKSK